MSLSTQPYKGTRDFYPEDKRKQKYMFSAIRRVAERFGYEEYDAPLLEPIEIYLAKTGQEIVDEQTYEFVDRGNRRVAIRPEMTPSVSRMVAARRQELAYPLRLYNLGIRWRYERPQHGRVREFWQLDADLFGIESIEAEHEIILLADKVLRELGAKRDMYTIRLNSRKLVDSILENYLGLDGTQAHTVSKLIDKMHKLEKGVFTASVEAALSPSQRESGTLHRLMEVLSAEELDDLPAEIQNSPGIKGLEELLKKLRDSLISNVKFDPSLMRGFDYYTDIVFEVFDTHPENNRAMFGGGRYDGLVGAFGVEPLPTVGFAMGDVTLQDFLEAHKLMPKLRTETDVYVVPIGDISDDVHHVVSDLREMGLNVAIDTTGRKPDKQIKTADKKGITHVLFIGEKEVETEQYVLKNLSTGKEEKHGLQRIVSIVKDYRG